MEIIAQAVRVIDYENNSVQRRNVNMMPKFKDYIEQLIVHVSNNVSIREYHTQSTRTEVLREFLRLQEIWKLQMRLKKRQIQLQKDLSEMNGKLRLGLGI